VPRQGSDGGGGPKRGVIPTGAGKAKKQVVFFDAAPPVAQRGGEEDGKTEAQTKVDVAAVRFLRRATKRTLSVLSNLPLAIAEMSAIAGLMALGMVFVLLSRDTFEFTNCF
jgi:cytochrome c biogenesis protein